MKCMMACCIRLLVTNTIFFTSCDGVKCRRICKPGDLLKMKVKVSRIRHPLACFQGEITVEGEKTASAEEVKLAFDYFPVIDGQKESSAFQKSSSTSYVFWCTCFGSFSFTEVRVIIVS